jgi:DNA segregation ATPase FtsK/SpoIIIE, S-DNA-T family
MSPEPAPDSTDAEVIDLYPPPPVAPAASVVDAAPGARRPVIPEPLRRGNMRGTITYTAGLGWHRVCYHGPRSPFYLVTYLWHSIRGCLVLALRVIRWWHAPHLHDLVSLAVASGRSGHHDAMSAHKEGRKTRTRRGQILAVCAVLALAIVLAAVAWLRGRPGRSWGSWRS